MADFSARSQTLRSNERVKHSVGVATALGTSLLVAAFARIGLLGGLDLYGLGWLIVAAMTIWFSSYFLNILEAEDRDD
jgi:hypothetical protein